MAYNKYRRHDRDIMLRRNKEILRMRSEGATLVETGENYGVTGERVRQIESEAQGGTSGPRKRKPAATKRASKPGIKRGSGTTKRTAKATKRKPRKGAAAAKGAGRDGGSSKRSASNTVHSGTKAPANTRKSAGKAKSGGSRVRSGAGSLRQSARPARKQSGSRRA